MKYFNVPEYYYRAQYPQHPFNLEHEPKPKGESIFNLLNDKESLNRINKIANQGVNHIVAAFYIKSVQQIRAKASEPANIPRRASVPVNSVNLEEKGDNEEIPLKNFGLDLYLSNFNTLGKNVILSQQKEIDKDTKDLGKDDTSKNNHKLNFNDANLINNNNSNTIFPFHKAIKVEEKEVADTASENIPNFNKNTPVNTDKELKTANFFNDINNSLNNIMAKNEKMNTEKEAAARFPNNIENFPKDNLNSRMIQGSNNATLLNKYNNISLTHPPIDREHKSNSKVVKSSFTEDLNLFTAQQLNTVSNMVKRIKENKMSEIIEKDNMNSGNSLKNK